MSTDADRPPPETPFRVVRKGYDRAQVDEHFDRTDAELRVTAADRDAAASQAADLASQLDATRADIDALRSRADRMSVLPNDTEGLSDRLRRMLRLAQDEASEIRARAEADSAEVRSVAEQEAGDLRARFETMIAQAEERRAAMEAEYQATMDAASADAARIVEAAATERDTADAAAADRRARIAEDFELAMGSRRAEALRTLQHDETTSKAEAERRVRDATTEAQRRLHRATEQAEHRVTAATARVEELRQLRSRIGDQLDDVRRLLERTMATLTALPEENATTDAGAAAVAGDGPDDPDRSGPSQP